MSLSSATARNDYSGNGSLAEYDYTFRILDETDLTVIVRDEDGEETELVLDTDFTVDGVGEEGGGSITLLDASQDWIDGSGNLDSGWELAILRERPLTQETAIRNQGAFFAGTHEDAFDHFIMVAQQLFDGLKRAMKLPKSFADLGDFFLPVPVENGIWRWNSDADGIEFVPEAELVTAQVNTGPSSIGSGVTQLAVTFGTAFEDTNYTVTANMSNVTDSSPDFQPVVITSKSTTGFTAKWNAATPTANYKLEWIAMRALS